MSLVIEHNVQKGVYQLLNAPKDIESATELPAITLKYSQASAEHKKLFDAYRKGFTFYYPMVERWWNGCIAAEQSEHRTQDQAIDAAFEKRMAGAASTPEFVWFVRYFWLRCSDLNKSVPLELRVAPEALMLGWLVDARDDDNITLMTCMPYWPIGLDEHGEWC